MRQLLKWTILCILVSAGFTACDSTDATRLDDVASTNQAILYGSYDSGDPAVVGLFHYTDYDTNADGSRSYYGSIYCTGTLIHPEWVLTAAHCVTKTVNGVVTESDNNSAMKVLIGSKLSGSSVYDVSHIYWNASYTKSSNGYDIAMLKLAKPMSDRVASPILPQPKWLSFNTGKLPTNMRLVGFGYDETGTGTDVKKEKTMPITRYCGLQNPYDSTAGCMVYNVLVKGCHPNEYLCEEYGYANGYVDVSMPYRTIYHPMTNGGECNGDSGGPSLLKIDGTEYVAGITSYGDAYCRGYNISTAVQDYYDWIIKVAPEVAAQYKEICGNGIDDDGNGLTDDGDPACIYCGNGIVNVGEQCDGSKFSNSRDSCHAWDSSYSGGTIRCNSDCTVDTSKCILTEYCGDGKLSEYEECDGSVFQKGISTCEKYDTRYTSGKLTCTKDCKIDESACKIEAHCGDGRVDGTEACDGSVFRDNLKTCSDLYPEVYSGGTLRCSSDCKLDLTSCLRWCGDGKINPDVNEVCDNTNFNGATCESLLGEGSKGTLKCENNCATINTSDCSAPTTCGNYKLDIGEDCDLYGSTGNIYIDDRSTCNKWDNTFSKGKLSCKADCSVDMSKCEVGTCGDNIVNLGEDCDGTLSSSQSSCKTLFPELYSGGTLTCTNSCKYDTSKCIPWCGNGTVETSTSKGNPYAEACDHTESGDTFPSWNNTCEKVVGEGSVGTLMCSTDCRKIITTGCSQPTTCGNQKVNKGEDCDVYGATGSIYLDDRSTCNKWDNTFSTGTLSCKADCSVDTSKCEVGSCGDHYVNINEDCDGPISSSQSGCKTVFPKDYSSGALKCTDSCRYDKSDCIPWCGNGVVNDTLTNGNPRVEKCDHNSAGDVFSITANTCEKVVGEGSKGTLHCSTDCSEIIVTDCSEPASCGDGEINRKIENCEGDIFRDDKTRCTDWSSKYISGNVKCTDKCSLVFSDCVLGPYCGDGIINNDEECDGSKFPIHTNLCRDFDDKYVVGRIKCNDDCSLDLNACRMESDLSDEICDSGYDEDGDDKIDCDDPDCKEDQACKPKIVCGDGILGETEDCDGTLFKKDRTTCHDWISVFKTGQVSCNKDCTINYDECSTVVPEICDNGKDDNDDGRIDCDDFDCIDFADCIPPEPKTEICDNSIDDNDDGLADCLDPTCHAFEGCTQKIVEICDNDIDDDQNGLTDCSDTEACGNAPECIDIATHQSKSSCTSTPYAPTRVQLPMLLLTASLLIRRRKLSK